MGMFISHIVTMTLIRISTNLFFFHLNVCNVWVVVGCWSLGIAMSRYWSWRPSIADGSKQCSEAMFTTIPHPTHAAHTYTTLSVRDSPFVLFLTFNGLVCLGLRSLGQITQ